MQRHKIVAPIILLILSVIDFALAAPLVRGIREAHVDVVGVAEDMTTASWKHWKRSGKWSTNATDRADTPPSLGLSDSDYRLEQELRPHDPGSPMDSNASPHLSLRSIDSDDSHPLPAGQPPPADKSSPFDIDSDASPRPSQEPKNGPDSGPHSTGSWTDGYDSASSSTYGSHSEGLWTDYHDSARSSGEMSPWRSYDMWAILKSPSSSPSPQHDSLDISPNSPVGLGTDRRPTFTGPAVGSGVVKKAILSIGCSATNRVTPSIKPGATGARFRILFKRPIQGQIQASRFWF